MPAAIVNELTTDYETFGDSTRARSFSSRDPVTNARCGMWILTTNSSVTIPTSFVTTIETSTDQLGVTPPAKRR